LGGGEDVLSGWARRRIPWGRGELQKLESIIESMNDYLKKKAPKESCWKQPSLRQKERGDSSWRGGDNLEGLRDFSFQGGEHTKRGESAPLVVAWEEANIVEKKKKQPEK